jgi:hypothetical protein
MDRRRRSHQPCADCSLPTAQISAFGGRLVGGKEARVEEGCELTRAASVLKPSRFSLVMAEEETEDIGSREGV